MEAKGPVEADEDQYGEGRVVYMDPSEREVELIVKLLAVMVFGDPNPEHIRQNGTLVRKTTLASGKFDFRRVLIAQEGVSAGTPPREVGQKQSRKEQDKNMRCHHFKELGHRKANCPKPQAQVQPEQKAITELVGLIADLKKKGG